ncbi:MAG TPA: V-type ATP synthase subunit E [Clostridia bacterium]|nr:V-type ATP synthase subunit E [Clostridia bacterium]
MMNGLTNISNKILADANLKADAIIAEAEQNAVKILTDSKKRAEAETGLLFKESAARCADVAEKGRLVTELEGKKLLSNARQQMISLTFKTALDRLLALPEGEYRKLLVKLANDVLADGKGGEILLNAKDLAAHGQVLSEALDGKATLAADDAPIVGGLIIRRGKIEYNCALDVLVRMVSENVAPEVSSALFSEGA